MPPILKKKFLNVGLYLRGNLLSMNSTGAGGMEVLGKDKFVSF
jgi:hypothetical protein